MPRKTIASLFLTPQCDMSCQFCASEQDFSVMTFEQASELLHALRDRSVRNVVLGGGEPFLWPHGLESLTRLAKRLGFLVQVCTNGVALPEDFQLILSIDRYLLPIESTDPHGHDALRRSRHGHHRIVMERIRTLAGSGRELTVSTVVTRENVDGLSEIADYLSEIRRADVALHSWHLYRFLAVGRGGERSGEHLSISRERFVRACARARNQARGTTVFRRDNMLRSSTVEFFWFEGGSLQIGSQVLPTITPAQDGAG